MLKLVSSLASGNIKLPRDAKEHKMFAFLLHLADQASSLHLYILHLGSTGDLIFAFPQFVRIAWSCAATTRAFISILRPKLNPRFSRFGLYQEPLCRLTHSDVYISAHSVVF